MDIGNDVNCVRVVLDGGCWKQFKLCEGQVHLNFSNVLISEVSKKTI